MPSIFVSYRRSDTSAVVEKLFHRLGSAFGRASVFVDVQRIEYGADFVRGIEEALGKCDVVLALIGSSWRGRRLKDGWQLDDPDDFVRMELRLSLSRSKPILPVLVGRTRMPARKTLPKDVQYLSRLSGVHLDDGREFERDAVRVVSAIHMMTSPHGAAHAGFELHFRSAEIDYVCRRCGYESTIEKLGWQRDGERPPTQCPRCGGRGYQEGSST